MHDDFSAFFGDNQPLLADLSAESVRKSFKKGELIVGEGDTDNSVFYILDGEANALRYSINGAEVFIDTFGSGDLVGEMAVLTNGPRTADIYALSDLQMAVFSAAAFNSLMARHGAMGLQVSRLLARRVLATTRRMFEQTTLSSKGRVYAELLRMAVPGSGSEQLILSVPSISDLAKKLNIARETVSRTFSELKANDIVKSRGRDLIIPSPHLLLERLN